MENDEGKRKTTFFKVRPYRGTDLAKIYGVGIDTFKKWIRKLKKELGTVDGHYFTIPQVEIIIHHLKLPYFIEVETVPESDLDGHFKKKKVPEKDKDKLNSRQQKNDYQ